MSYCKNPLLKLVVYFVIGLSLSIYFSLCNWLYPFLLIISVFSLVLVEAKFIRVLLSINAIKFLREVLLFISLFLGGIVVGISHHDNLYPNYYGKILNNYNCSENTTSIVEIDEAIQIKNKSIQCKVSIDSLTIKGAHFSVFGKGIVYLPKNQLTKQLLPGDKIKVLSTWKSVEPPKNPGQFNYKNYLKFHKIEWVNYVKENQWEIIGSNLYNINRYGVMTRNSCIKIFESSSLDQQNLAIASALTFGYKDELNSTTKHAFSSTGAMHVLAVSGLHVGIVFLILNFLLDVVPILNKRNWIKYSLILIFMWFYALITGFSPSVLRATTMLSFVVLGLMINRSSNVYNSMAASAFFLLLINPFLIMQVGFQLSYLAVGGILFIQPKIEKLYQPKNILLKKIWTLTTVSIAAQCATFPLGVLYFHQFPNYFLLSNLIVIPMAFVILFLGLLLIITSSIDWIYDFIGEVLNFLVTCLNISVNFIDRLPFAMIEGVSVSIVETFLFYFVLMFTLLFFIKKSRLYLYVSFVLLSFTFYLDLQENLIISSQKKLIVYHTNEPLAIDLIGSDKHYFISSTNLFLNEDQMLFNVKHNWYNNDLKEPVFLNADSIKNKRIDFLNKSLIYLSKQPQDFTFKNDVVLISGTKDLEYNKLLKSNYAKMYVLMNDMSYKQKSFFKKKCIEYGADFHDLAKNGAYELTW